MQSTPEDMKTLTITVQELNDRTEIRVWKSLVSSDMKAKKKIKVKTAKK